PIWEKYDSIHLDVVSIDKCENKNSFPSEKGWRILVIDIENPGIPQDIGYEKQNYKDIHFEWESSQEDCSGIKNYQIKINGNILDEEIEGTNYLYQGGYNEEVIFSVSAWDNAGNHSDFSSTKTVYTDPRLTLITNISTYGSITSGYGAAIKFLSVGEGAAGYQIMYQPLGGLEKIIDVGAISTSYGGSYTKYLSNLSKHEVYLFKIRTSNSKTGTPDYSEWVEYGTIQINNNPPSVPELVSPEDGAYINCDNIDQFKLIANKSADLDNDLLTYKFIVNEEEYNALTDQTGKKYYTPTLTDGNYNWCVSVSDSYNTTLSANREFTVDIIPPLRVEFSLDKNFVGKEGEVIISNIITTDSDVTKLKFWSDADNVIHTIDKKKTHTFSLPKVEGKQIIYMKAEDLAGNLSEDSYQCELIYDVTSPGVPEDIKLEAGVHSVNITWNCTDKLNSGVDECSGIDYYKIYYKKVDTENWSSKNVNGNINSYTITEIGENEKYEVKLMAYDKAGNYSEVSDSYSGWSLPSVGKLSLNQMGYEQNLLGEYAYYIKLSVIPENSHVYKIIRQNQNTGEEIISDWIDSSIATYLDYVEPHGNYRYGIQTCNSSPSQDVNPTISWEDVELSNNLPSTPITTVEGFINQLRPTLETESVIDVDGDGLRYYYYIEEEQNGIKVPIVEWEEANDSNIYYHLTNNLKGGYTYSYQVGVVDEYMEVPGVISEKAEFTVDITAPEINIELPLEIRDKVLEGNFVKDATVVVSAVDKNSAIVDGNCSGLKSIYYYWNEESNKVTILSDTTISVPHGINTLYIVAEDNIGNISQPKTYIFKVDQTEPVVSDLKVHGSLVNGETYTRNQEELFATFALTDEETQIDSIQYAIVIEDELPMVENLSAEYWKSIDVKEGIENHYNLSAAKNFEEGEKYFIAIKACNEVGGETIVVSNGVIVDVQAPEIKFLDQTGNIPMQYLLTDLSELTLQIEVTDLSSGVASVKYALVTNLENITDWKLDISNLSECSIEDGEKYYLVVSAEDYLGNGTLKDSVPIVIDSTAPVFESLKVGNIIPGTNQYQVQWDQTYLKFYFKIKDEINLSELRYCIGITQGGKDISSKLCGNKDGWLKFDLCDKEISSTIENLSLNDGIYYLTVEATNEVGLKSTKISNPLEINTTLTPWPIVQDDGIYIDRKEIHFSVFFTDEEQLDESYQYQIIDENGLVLVENLNLENPHKLPDVSLTMSESNDLVMESGETYYVVLGQNENGLFEPVSYSDGVTLDCTAPIFVKFADGEYFKEDNVYLSWEAMDLESEISEYCYQIGMTRGGGELTEGWVEIGIQDSVVLKGYNFIENELYFLTVKATNGAGKEVIKMGDGFRIDKTPPPIPLVLPEGNYTNKLNRLQASWVWTKRDLESGTLEYYYDYLTVKDATMAEWKPVAEITGDPLATTLELIDLNLENGQTYYIAIKAIDKVGFKSIGISAGIMADVEAPTTPIIDDLRYSQDFIDKLTAHFYSRDDESGIFGYKFAIGTWEDSTSIMDWVEITSAEETVSNLSLLEGNVYFFTALATDNSGLRSAISRSDGVLIDLQKPKITNLETVGEYSTDSEELFFEWQSEPSYAPIVRYEYSLSTVAYQPSSNWQST
ncbi:MAG: fibronectin type III domain-containing protein, partial [Halanaerobiales bacterium]|nr:fibronectin type III domain-containing protein [Halanaerobiales bacterium]